MRTVRFISPEPDKNIDFCVPVLLPIMLGILSKTLYNPDTPFAVLEPCLYSKHIGSMTTCLYPSNLPAYNRSSFFIVSYVSSAGVSPEPSQVRSSSSFSNTNVLALAAGLLTIHCFPIGWGSSLRSCLFRLLHSAYYVCILGLSVFFVLCYGARCKRL